MFVIATSVSASPRSLKKKTVINLKPPLNTWYHEYSQPAYRLLSKAGVGGWVAGDRLKWSVHITLLRHCTNRSQNKIICMQSMTRPNTSINSISPLGCQDAVSIPGVAIGVTASLSQEIGER